MRPHDVNHRVSSKLREIVGTDHGIVVAAPYIVHTRLELNEVVHVRPAVSGPFHVADDATERKTAVRVSARQVFEELQHPVLIEVTVTKICFGVGSKLELPTLLGGGRIDACRSQASQMIVMLSGIYHVDGLIAALKAVLYEWKQRAVLFVVAVKKRADVTYVAQLGTGEGNWRHGPLHGVYLALLWIAWQTDIDIPHEPACATSKPNVYQTLVLVRHSRTGPGSCRRLMTPRQRNH
jgi:hypothetical protein